MKSATAGSIKNAAVAKLSDKSRHGNTEQNTKPNVKNGESNLDQERSTSNTTADGREHFNPRKIYY